MAERKFQASVKVMRSHDYCHFECQLGTDDLLALDEIDDMRKQAAILVDEAVRQYRTAKKKESDRERKEWEKVRSLERYEQIKEKPKREWSVEEAAIMRSVADKSFWKEFHEDDYCYTDPERDHHFSMLRRFKETRISCGSTVEMESNSEDPTQ